MKIIHILPELEEGGVERHVLWLTEKLVARGHEVLVVSSGGKMTAKLAPGISHLRLPVHAKNPLTAFFCSRFVSRYMGKGGWEILHAHSRVPAWISMWAAGMAGRPYVVTAHVVFGNQSPWIYRPYRKADRVICVSSAVETGMKKCFRGNTQVVINGMPKADTMWQGPRDKKVHFLFIGRLSPVKGIQDIMEILPSLKGNWSLDIVGDGQLYASLSDRIGELGLEDKVFLRGFRDDTDEWLAECSCLLFPSYTEGMPLTLARAIQMGVPVLASDIPPVAEMAESREGLLPPGDKRQWEEALRTFLERQACPRLFSPEKIPTAETMTDEVEKIYAALVQRSVRK